MTERDDDRLLELLGAALAMNQAVPAELSDDARAVFTWRTIDAELLSLSFDSAVDELTGVRSSGTAERLLRFFSGDVEVEVDVIGGDLEGMVTGAQLDVVRLERPDGTLVDSDVDEHGRFLFEAVEAGPLRLHIGEGGPVTEWFLV
ncbi:MAG TPA: hypothetical protein VJ938_03090 [Acidimicrobiia bacterium]|nr:hypothetical protein [Acidimicrobiia bacterium]